MPVPNATARLEARISADLHGLLKRAAEIEGRTMTDYIVAAVQSAARRTLEEAEIVRLSVADQVVFARILSEPPAPTAALKRAAERHRRLIAPE
ncbi:MAG: DUF1778 domain-containing protein [Asticcacaulis sp.]